jgi:excinuclease ABC subunit A
MASGITGNPEIRYKGKSISDVLNMTVDEAVEFFQAVPYIYRKIRVLQEVGLGYITLAVFGYA